MANSAYYQTEIAKLEQRAEELKAQLSAVAKAKREVEQEIVTLKSKWLDEMVADAAKTGGQSKK